MKAPTNRMRIGELLGQMGKLSGHDIDEILQEQSASGHRFGDIALTWGLVQPQHIWTAWCSQLQEDAAPVDLDQLGIDAQVTARIPGELAWRLHAMPVRRIENQLVFAISDLSQVAALQQFEKSSGVRVRFVLADAKQIDAALKQHYPKPREAV
jgi:hypothetical protein